MQRRDFLRSGLLLGATGTVPGATLAVNNFDEARRTLLADNIAKYATPPTRTGLVLPPLDNSDIVDLLIHAISRGHVQLVKSLIAQGADVQAADGFGLTPLHHAACHVFDENILTCLVSHGADAHAKDGSGGLRYTLPRIT